MENKAISKRGIYILLVLLLLAICSSIVLSAFAFSYSNDILNLLKENIDDPNQETQEDDVKIGSYVICSTRPISDAYLSGDDSALDDKEREILDMASAILQEIITDDMSDFEQEKAVYDWMTSNLGRDHGLLTVIPTTRADCDNPYGALKYHNAVCVGYATTFRLFMQMLDIPCMVVHNTDRYHSWDLVQIGGDWYHTDIYSDVEDVSYNSFNMTDTMLSARGQSWDTDFYPAANSMQYNTVYLNSIESEDILEFPVLLRAALERKENLLSVRYGSDLTEAQANALEKMVEAIGEILHSNEEYMGVYMSNMFYPVEQGYLMVVNIYGLEEEPEDERLSEEDEERITETIQEVFADMIDEENQDWMETWNYGNEFDAIVDAAHPVG